MSKQFSNHHFELAADAIVNGDIATLNQLLNDYPDLIYARSEREHHATLLNYVGANGFENERQKTPKNIVEITNLLLAKGAEVDAVQDSYGGTTTLGLVATSVHPFIAGVQNELIDLLLEHGADLSKAVAPDYTKGNFIVACLANGRGEAAMYLASRGAPLNLEAAAGTGNLDEVKKYFNEDGTLKDPELQTERDRGFIWACGYGHIEVVKYLLDHRCVPIDVIADGSTGLHMAVVGGHQHIIAMLLERNAPLEIKNSYGGTVLGQALWSAYNEPAPVYLPIIETLLSAGAVVKPGWEKYIDEIRQRYAKIVFDENLTKVVLQWRRDVSDADLMQLANCENIEYVDVMGTATGDAVIEVLAGKKKLRHLKTGMQVTDAGIAMLHKIPVFKTWQGGEEKMWLTGFEAEPNYLKLDGTFTDAGIEKMVGLDGLFALNLDNDKLNITAACLEHLAKLPNLKWLGFNAKDESMPGIAALPRLKFLMCQDTVAGDDGFVALSHSQTIEYIWGRRCYNLSDRGFIALADMPALRSLSVSCKNVSDEGLAALPRFAALRELMPMDVPDEGYRFIGACEQLERLVLMYCRDTTDVSTSHIMGLKNLKYYFASYNKITDRSMEMLSGVQSLEHVSLSNVAGVTVEGLKFLGRLPNLKCVELGGIPNVSKDDLAVLPKGVKVRYQED